MVVHKTEALTLKCSDYSETSQVVAILTRQMGKVRLLAKGSRRGRTNFGGPLEPWTRAEALFSLRNPNRLGTLTEFYELEEFRGLRQDLKAYFAACYMTELVLALVPDLEPQSQVFDLTVDVLRMLARRAAQGAKRTGGSADLTAVFVFYFEVQVLKHLGYWPQFRPLCIECSRQLPADLQREFSPSLGGLVCPACRVKANDIVVLKAKAVEALEFLARTAAEHLERVRLNPETACQMRSLIQGVLAQILGRQLACARYV